MTTRANDRVIIEPSGIVRCCAWCLPTARLAELHRLHQCTDTLCEPCAEQLEQEIA